jgi:hypothetical protein
VTSSVLDAGPRQFRRIMTTPQLIMTPLLLRFFRLLSWIILGMGVGAGLLYLVAAAGPESTAIIQVVLGIAGLAAGCLLGRLLRPLTRWRPPVPSRPESASPPAENAAALWVQSFAAGFWVLVALTLAATFLFDAMVHIAGVSVALLSLSPLLILLYVLTACGMVPLGLARGVVGPGAGLPRWTLSAASGAACLGGLALFVAISLLTALLQSLDPGIAGNLAGLLALAGVAVIAVGTPVLAQSRRPSLSGPAWAALLALAALVGAWLLFVRLVRWISPLGPLAAFLWLLLACLLWGGSGGAVLAVLSARWRIRGARRAEGRESVPPLAPHPCEHTEPGH